MNLEQIKKELRLGQFAWPGGYQKYFITDDGAALSFEAVYDNFKSVCQDHMSGGTGWRVCAVDINYEDDNLICDHTNEKIQAAYGED